MELSIPVSGGNVSFYNQTGEEPILPTPVVGVLGVIDDVHKAIGNELGTVGEKEVLIALGETKDEFGGSIWQQVSADTSDASSLNGLPPQVDMANEKRLAEFFHGNDLLTAAHDISEGGLAVTAFEMAKRAGATADGAGWRLVRDAVLEGVGLGGSHDGEGGLLALGILELDRGADALARQAERFGIRIADQRVLIDAQWSVLVYLCPQLRIVCRTNNQRSNVALRLYKRGGQRN